VDGVADGGRGRRECRARRIAELAERTFNESSQLRAHVPWGGSVPDIAAEIVDGRRVEAPAQTLEA